MDRTLWLLLAWLPLMGCEEMASEVLSAPADVTSADSDDSVSPSDAPSDGRSDRPDVTSPTSRPSSPSAPSFTLAPAEPDSLADALDACANDGIDSGLFERAYEARLCEEWAACDGSECSSGVGGEAGRSDEDDFDADAACDCLESAWSCETSYGASSELRVVVPDVACFAVY